MTCFRFKVNLQPFTTTIELILAWIAYNKLKCIKVAQMHGRVGDGVCDSVETNIFFQPIWGF